MRTDKPFGQRPVCSECGSHRWSYDGRCLSKQCIETKEVKKAVEELPSWLKKKPKSKVQKVQMFRYCKRMGIDPPQHLL